MDSEHANGSNHNPAARQEDVSRSGSSRHSRTDSEPLMVNESGNRSGSSDFIEVQSRSSSSSSSSTSSSSSKDLPEVNPDKAANAQPSSSSKDESVGHTAMSETESPPIQVMDRSGGYDPNRIPSSVFERSKSNIPVEWSCASNESLFSIHIGNNSFSVYGDPTKSGELFKSGELHGYSPSPPLPPSLVEPKEKTGDVEKKVEAEEDVMKEGEAKSGQPIVSWKSPTTSYRSDRSTNSTHSFSFPILAEGVASEAAKPEAEEQPIKPAAPEAKPNPSSNSWFSCLPCCPRCCSARSRS